MIKTNISETPAHPLRHVAIIMDGNNRWAKERGLLGLEGHKAGVERVRDILDACREHRVEALTLFAFSRENWQRPAAEVGGLMSLFATYLKKELKELIARGVCLRVVGARDRFSKRLCKLIEQAEAATAAGNVRLTLAVDYGGRWDISEAAKTLAEQVQAGRLEPADINETMFEQALCLADLPPLDLCIRTAGEHRISNFLLWQAAYTEFYFANCYWPDFDNTAFAGAVDDYYQRQRRFGLTGDQLKQQESKACSSSE